MGASGTDAKHEQERMREMKFTAHQGNVVGQSDDEIVIITDGCTVGHRDVSSVEDAMRQALAWAAESDWPDEGEYSAVVWVEGEDGTVLAQEDVEIKCGRMMI